MSDKAKKAFNEIRDCFDRAVAGLSPAEYLEVINETGSHVDACRDCVREENPEMDA